MYSGGHVYTVFLKTILAKLVSSELLPNEILKAHKLFNCKSSAWLKVIVYCDIMQGGNRLEHDDQIAVNRILAQTAPIPCLILKILFKLASSMRFPLSMGPGSIYDYYNLLSPLFCLINPASRHTYYTQSFETLKYNLDKTLQKQEYNHYKMQ